MNLYEFFVRFGEWRPSDSAIEDLDHGITHTYEDLEAESARLANRLRKLGLKPGDRLAAQVDKSPRALFLYLACLRAGVVYLPLNTAYSPEEVRYFLSDAGAALYVCDPARAAVMAGVAHESGARLETLDPRGKGTLVEHLHEEPSRFETLARGDEDLAAILYTSGTTGRSKGAMLSHLNLRSNAEALARAWGFTREDRLLHALPIYHVHGLFISLHCALSTGSRVLWLARFDAHEVLKALPRASVFMGVPTYYTRLLEELEFTRERCAGTRLFVSGSAPLLPQTFEAFESRTGHRILERYGMTETGINTSNPLKGARLAGSVGPALPGVEVRVREGMIEVRGPNVFKGYWRQPGRAAEDFTEDGFFRTGDLGEWSAEGYLRIVGRAKDLVISGGLNVYPKEVELEIDSIEGVAESAVFGVPHPDFGEAVVAAVVRAPGAAGEALDERAIQERLRGRLAGFKLPKRVLFVESLPRNAMGKVQKNALRASYEGLMET